VIIALINLVIFIVGVVAISTIVVTIIEKLFFKGLDELDALIQRRSVPSPSLFTTSNHSGYERENSKTKINPTNSPVYSHKIPYEISQPSIITTHRNSPFKETHTERRYKNHYRNKNNRENLKSFFGYFKHSVPISHIGSIVNWLRRRVNQSGKEPSKLCCFRR